MAKTTMVGVRLSPAERDALERACHHEHRSMSSLGRILILQWMRAGGWLPADNGQANADNSRQGALKHNPTATD
jgi:hypothetical protein